MLETRGAPILNPVTGAEHRVRIEQPNGFEFTIAEIGRGWSKAEGPLSFELSDTYSQSANIHLCRAASSALERSWAMNGMMALHGPVIAGGLLIAVGVHQLTPLKENCLTHCRSPAAFLATHWRPHDGCMAHGARPWPIASAAAPP